MVNINEYGRYFSAYSKKTEPTAHDFYVDDWSWDTFRSLHPLRFLIDPEREADMIKSYILMGEQSGWMPTFPQISGDAKCMIDSRNWGGQASPTRRPSLPMPG